MFWEVAGMFMNVIQMGLYISGLSHYKDKLTDLADDLSDWGDINRDHYLTFRACDPEFYEYYKELPDYEVCESNIRRSKGAAFHRYGSKMRRALRTNRGYTPMTKVHLNHALSSDAVSQVALTRAVSRIKEVRRVDDHILERWSAIVSAPIGVERYQAGAVSEIIKTSFTTLKSLGQGFNSAGASFGTQLYKVLN